MSHLQYFVRYVYGEPTMYLTGNGSEEIRSLTGRKTITNRDLNTLTSLGFTLERVEDPKTVSMPASA